jgi:SWI/SNF-related matrix-associated actin-dependent regulator of chromatin subfamily A member 5
VFRFVTEHTIEEKVVERAQQKLKLDAMVVQSGRLKEKDKLSRDELLNAVRFGADKVFKSKDSSITDDDIDLILDAGKRKTQELNEKLQNADKGDLLDFKLDGGGLSAQMFEGVDYSDALARAAQAEFLSIMDIGKRERKTVANYNENQLYQQQVAAFQGPPKPKKKKIIRLPKSLRLPKMEEWQMYDRTRLLKIQEEEEKAFRALPEEQIKLATMKPADLEAMRDETGILPVTELPPLLSESMEAEKKELLSEGFDDWGRLHYSAFIKGSAKYGRQNFAKIANDVGKPQNAVETYAAAFWDETLGKKRFLEHEYDRVVKLIERGEKKIEEIKRLERGTRVFLSLFDNPWEELEFTYVNCKDKMFTMDEDRSLLCWAFKVRICAGVAVALIRASYQT